MSIADFGAIDSGSYDGNLSRGSSTERPLHRLGAVRRQQGISQRNIARHLSIDVGTVRSQEQEESDLLLSTLYAWQKVLQVPVAELLVDSDAPLSPPVLARAQVLKLMKTALAIRDRGGDPGMRRLVQMLIDQILEIMPELKSVGPWHPPGQRRADLPL